jgi:enoyl-CoA hydratase
MRAAGFIRCRTGGNPALPAICRLAAGVMKGDGWAMAKSAFLIAPQRLHPGESPWDGPLAVVDLDAGGDWPDAPTLPPCPLIGLGSRDHPAARHCDAIIEPPVSLQAVERLVCAHPEAAAVAVQLLRLVPQLPDLAALDAESLAYATLQGSADHRDWLAHRPVAVPQPEGRIAMKRDDALLEIVLDRPSAGNAIDREMRDGLCVAFSLAVLDSTIEHVVMSGKGRCFSLGADLAEFGTTTDPATAHAIRARTLPSRLAVGCDDRLEARLHGACVGAGLELAAWARRVVARADSWFQLPELAMGIMPGAGGCVSLSRRIGRQRTALMLLSGRRVSVRTALDWGLVDAIVDDLPG